MAIPVPYGKSILVGDDPAISGTMGLREHLLNHGYSVATIENVAGLLWLAAYSARVKHGALTGNMVQAHEATHIRLALQVANSSPCNGPGECVLETYTDTNITSIYIDHQVEADNERG